MIMVDMIIVTCGIDNINFIVATCIVVLFRVAISIVVVVAVVVVVLLLLLLFVLLL